MPAETIAFVRVTDYGDLLSRLKRTALGHMNDDNDSFAFAFHFVEALLDYQFPASRVARREGDIKGQAWSLRESVTLDLGEIVWFEAKRPDGSLGWGLLVDARGESEAIAKIVKGHCAQHTELGGGVTEEQRGKATLTVLSQGEEPADSGPRETILRYDTIFGLASDSELLVGVAAALDGSSLDAMRQNPVFAKTMDRLDERSGGAFQMEFFIDPSSLSDSASDAAFSSASAREAAAGDSSALKTSPATNGIVAAAGRLWVATDKFDFLLDVECSRNQPVSAVESLLTLRNEDLTVESWVPAQAASYSSIKFDLRTMRLALKQPTDGVEGLHSFERAAAQRFAVADHPSFDELLHSLGGRFSRATLFDPSTSPPLEVAVYSTHCNDRQILERALRSWAANGGSRLAESSYEGQPYFQQSPATLPASTGTLCVCFLGDNLLIADHPWGIERAIDAHRGTSALGQQLDYRLVASRLRSLAGKQELGAVFFARPESYLRSYYDVLASEANRQWLLHLSSVDPLWRAAQRALEECPLPSFKALEKHLAPCGGFINDEDESLRLAFFWLRRGKARD